MPLFYLIAGSYTVIKLPITNFKKTLVGDKATTFKRKIRDKALEYYESSEGRKTALEGFQVPFIFVQEMKYIEEVIFSSADKTLHRSDLEMLSPERAWDGLQLTAVRLCIFLGNKVKFALHKPN